MKETFTCIDCLSNQTIQVELENNIIISKKIIDEVPSGELFIGPGLIDLQINGFNGVDFNTFPIEESDFVKAIEALAKEGVTSFFPTVITNSEESIIALLENIDQLCKKNAVIDAFVSGVHLEGPFISPEEGARGAHDRAYIKAPDWELFEKFQNASGHRIKIITISSEWDNATGFIKKCVKEDVIVALGHTLASPEQVKSATLAGASMSTHLGNGVPLSLPRNSNVIFEQLANDELTASLIADGYHLPESFLKTVLKTKINRTVLVSDSTMFAGMASGVYNSHIGGKVLLEEGGRLSTYNNNKILAGSAVSLLDCVTNLVKSELSSLDQAWSLASVCPAKLVGYDQYQLNSTDLVLFELADATIVVKEVFKNNKRIYSKK